MGFAMTTGRTLLQRLENPREGAARDLPGDLGEVLDSIRSHLQLMLNTRQGNALTVPDFGTVDFSEVTKGYQTTHRFQDELRRCIEKFEPRLRHVRVAFQEVEDQPFTLHFDISADLFLDGEERPTAFRSVIDASGKVKVAQRR